MATIPEALAVAVQHHQAGRLQAAEQIYRQILAAEPNQPDVLHLLGMVAYQAGKHDFAIECIGQAIAANGRVAIFHSNLGAAYLALRRVPEAVDCYRRAVDLRPNFADSHFNLGVALREQGKLDEAVACYRRALELMPDFAAAHNNLANALQHQGKLVEAVGCYRRALELKPDYAEAYNNLANALQHQGSLDEAVTCYRRTLELKPDYAEAYNNLAGALQNQGKSEEAVACCCRALELKPGYAEAHNNLGTVLQGQGNLDEAVACYRRALELRPDFAEAYNNLAIVFTDQARLDEAVACCRRAVELKPAFAAAHSNLGLALLLQGKLDQAITYCHRAVELKPGFAEGHNNLGIAWSEEGKLDEAVACYRRALALKPDYAEAHENYAHACLQVGDWQRGWLELEWRRQTKPCSPRRFIQPLWNGESLAGKTILLHAEQGLGDTIQFVRYVPLVRRYNARVIVECQKPLLRLLAGCPGIDQLIGEGDELPAFDVHAPLMSLPAIVNTTLESIPAGVPYIFAAPELVAHWQERLGSIEGFKIGISWQGNPRFRGDRFRSIPLRYFAALARLPGVSLISLQKGAGREQLAEVRNDFPVVDLGDELDEEAGPFMDRAAVMKNLDLVVTSDTAIAHLTGALGLPVWVALKFAADWRWLLDRSDSPWYPTMRLFRQQTREDWSSVFNRMAAALPM
ncbi:MAG: tetratricopeptide repeat protein [Thermoguttaceae bacterium]|jgi:tetratricopeptide (TPR) repeat protein